MKSNEYFTSAPVRDGRIFFRLQRMSFSRPQNFSLAATEELQIKTLEKFDTEFKLFSSRKFSAAIKIGTNASFSFRRISKMSASGKSANTIKSGTKRMVKFCRNEIDEMTCVSFSAEKIFKSCGWLPTKIIFFGARIREAFKGILRSRILHR